MLLDPRRRWARYSSDWGQHRAEQSCLSCHVIQRPPTSADIADPCCKIPASTGLFRRLVIVIELSLVIPRQRPPGLYRATATDNGSGGISISITVKHLSSTVGPMRHRLLPILDPRAKGCQSVQRKRSGGCRSFSKLISGPQFDLGAVLCGDMMLSRARSSEQRVSSPPITTRPSLRDTTACSA